MKIQSLDNFEPVNNQILIRVTGKFADKIQIKDANGGNTELQIDALFNPEMNMTVTGEVILAPKTFIYGSKGLYTPWKTTIQVESGDKVWMSYSAISKAFPKDGKDDRIIIVENDVQITGGGVKWRGVYILVDYCYLIVAKRGEEIIPLNGQNLVEPIMWSELPATMWPKELEPTPMDNNAGVLKVHDVFNTPAPGYGIVVKKAEPNIEYTGPNGDPCDLSDDVEFEEGDIVLVVKNSDIPISVGYQEPVIPGVEIIWKVQARFFQAIIER